MNQHQLDTVLLVCVLRVNASTCFGRYSLIFRRLCTDAIWCNYVRRMCVECVQVTVTATFTHPTHIITPHTICAGPPEDGRETPET
jgi:hypothetical protein